MERNRKLKLKAIEICNQNNRHFVRRFERLYVNVITGEKTHWWRARCKFCDMFVDINHEATGIISGSAIESKCHQRERWIK